MNVVLQIAAIEYLNPMVWWGLLGLLVPVLIHLLSKKERKIIPFGSLRFLEPIESDSARSIQLSGYVLLMLRLLLVGLICALLFQPFTRRNNAVKNYWVEN